MLLKKICIFVFRLCSHYETCEISAEKPVRLIDISLHYYQSDLPLQTLSKTLTRIFPSIQRIVTYRNNKKYPSFMGIRRIGVALVLNTIEVEHQFKASRSSNGSLSITCPTVWKVLDTPVELTAEFGAEALTFMCQGFRLTNGDYGLPKKCVVSQQSVQAVSHVMQQLRICRGKPCTTGAKLEVWSNIITGESEKRLRSPRCDTVVQLMSIDDICQSCKSMFRKRQQLHEGYQNEGQKLRIQGTDVEDSDSETIKLSETEHNQMLEIMQAVQDKHANLKSLLDTQVKNQSREPTGRRWSKDVIRVCLSLYCRSPRAYTDFKSSGVLLLPSTRLLRYYKNSVSQAPGLSVEHLSWMSKEAENAMISEFGRRGGILIDEMTIQDDIQIVKKGDAWSVVGMVDMGQACNNVETIINGRTTLTMATHVLQIVFHGLSGFRWPVAYFGTTSVSAHQLYRLFWEVVDKLDDNGFSVEYLMMDGASSNRSLTNILINGDKVAERYSFVNIYDKTKRISVIQDIKHCLKKLRNGIESSKASNKSLASKGKYLVLKGQPILWDHFEQAFTFNDQLGLRVHPKLTKDHIQLTPTSKMRNELATSVLDKHMLYLMKAYQSSCSEPESLDSTVALLKTSSVLVDIFHDKNRPIRVGDNRLDQLQECLTFFSQWENDVIESRSSNEKKHLLSRECREDLKSTILGFQSLAERVLCDGHTITPGWLNSDLIENFFCQQRGIRHGCNTNPTLSQYGPAVNAICLGQSSVSNKSNSGDSSFMVTKASLPGSRP